MRKEDIEKLAKLSRLSLKDEEKDSFVGDFNSILDYVSQIEEASVGESVSEDGVLRNVMREDGSAIVSDDEKEILIANIPSEKDGFVKVKQVFE